MKTEDGVYTRPVAALRHTKLRSGIEPFCRQLSPKLPHRNRIPIPAFPLDTPRESAILARPVTQPDAQPLPTISGQRRA